MPLYYNLASKLEDDPLERLKMIISADVSSVIYTETFEKPLNPVLGETYKAHGQDGANFYMEQISHHPPTLAVLIEHENYTYSNTTEWAIHAGL